MTIKIKIITCWNIQFKLLQQINSIIRFSALKVITSHHFRKTYPRRFYNFIQDTRDHPNYSFYSYFDTSLWWLQTHISRVHIHNMGSLEHRPPWFIPFSRKFGTEEALGENRNSKKGSFRIQTGNCTPPLLVMLIGGGGGVTVYRMTLSGINSSPSIWNQELLLNFIKDFTLPPSSAFSHAVG